MLNIHGLERTIQAQMAAAEVPGMALALVQNGEVTYARGFGTTSIEGGPPVSPQTLFRIGSITKPMTASLVLSLAERDLLDLDTPILAYVPDLPFSDAAYGAQVTLRQLLSHTAGLPSDYAPDGRRDADALRAYIYENLPNYAFVFPPERVYSYSNVGLRLAGYVAQAVMDTPYTDLMAEQLFAPLGMQHTTFDPLVAMTYPLAQAHVRDSATDTLRVLHHYPENAETYPSGGAFSTVLDLAQFAIMHLMDGDTRQGQILQPTSARAMRAAHASRYMGQQSAYGLGWSLWQQEGQLAFGHDGLTSSFGGRLVAYLPENIAIIALCNYIYPFWPAIDTLFAQVFSALVDTVTHPMLAMTLEVDLKRYAGTYIGAERGLAEVVRGLDGLELIWNGVNIPLMYESQDLYVGRKPESAQPIMVGFVPYADPNDHKSRGFEFLMLNGSPCRQTAPPKPYDAEADDALTLGLYEGRYVGPDELTFWLSDNTLWVRSREYAQAVPCLPLEPTLFACDFGLLRFTLERDTAPRLSLADVYQFQRASDPV